MQSYGPIALHLIALSLLLAGAISFVILVKGAFVLRRLARNNPREEPLALMKSRLTPSVTVILAPPSFGPPARALTRRLVGLHFGNHEVVVALNAPNETDLAAWRDEFHLEPSKRPIAGAPAMAKVRDVFEARAPLRLVVLNLEPTVPPLALNAAVNAAQSPVIGLFADDCDFEPEVLLRLIRPMLEDPHHTVAVCGISPREAGEGLRQQFAALDFLRAWLSRAAAFSGWNLLTPIKGSGMLVSRYALARAGGFRAGPLEMFLQLHAMCRRSQRKYRIAFEPNAGCSRRALRSDAEILRAAALSQREAACCAATPSALPAWLRAGIFAIHFAWPTLETAAYVLTLFGLIAGWVNGQLALLMLLSTVGLGMLLSMSVVSLRELAEFRGSDPARLTRLFLAAIVENLGFRQVRNLRLLAAMGRD